MRVRMIDVTDELVGSAGIDSTQDAWRRGYLNALTDILNIDFSEE